MSYLFKAAETMGIYFTPSRILALGYGDGKTATHEYIAGNPPWRGNTMTDTTRTPDTVYGHPGYWTKHGNVSVFACDNGMTIEFWMPESAVAKPGPIEAVVDDYELAIRQAGDLSGAEL